MKAVLDGQQIAASDDIVEVGGYQYFPPSAVRMDLLQKTAEDRVRPGLSAWRAVLRRGAQRRPPRPQRLDLQIAAAEDGAGQGPRRLLGGRPTQLRRTLPPGLANPRTRRTARLWAVGVGRIVLRLASLESSGNATAPEDSVPSLAQPRERGAGARRAASRTTSGSGPDRPHNRDISREPQLRSPLWAVPGRRGIAGRRLRGDPGKS